MNSSTLKRSSSSSGGEANRLEIGRGYTAVTASWLYSRPRPFASVYARSRTASRPFSCTPMRALVLFQTPLHPRDASNGRFLNLGSGVRFPSGTPFKPIAETCRPINPARAGCTPAVLLNVLRGPFRALQDEAAGCVSRFNCAILFALQSPRPSAAGTRGRVGGPWVAAPPRRRRAVCDGARDQARRRRNLVIMPRPPATRSQIVSGSGAAVATLEKSPKTKPLGSVLAMVSEPTRPP